MVMPPLRWSIQLLAQRALVLGLARAPTRTWLARLPPALLPAPAMPVVLPAALPTYQGALPGSARM